MLITTDTNLDDGHGKPLTACCLRSLLETALARTGGPAQREAEKAALAAAIWADSEIARLGDRLAHMRRLALTDEVTGLLNRRGFMRELARALGHGRRHGETSALIVVDLDNFKAINDTFGHGTGDQVLRHVGGLLLDFVRATDVVARLGGDEFALLLLRSEADGAHRRARALTEFLNRQPLTSGEATIAVRASVGCADFTGEEVPLAVLSKADAAMYRQKRHRRKDGTQAAIGVDTLRTVQATSALGSGA